MPELLLELLTEEIPARMQARAADDLLRLATEKLGAAGLNFGNAHSFVTPRRLVLVVEDIPVATADISEERRGPRVGAPPNAIEGFLKSAGVTLAECQQRDTGKGVFYFAVIRRAGRATAAILPVFIHAVVLDLPWPKSMRFPAASFRWVRPLTSVLCLFDGEIVPLNLGAVPTSDETRGHRFLAPDKFSVCDFADYRRKLRDAHVVLDAKDRRQAITLALHERAAEIGLTVKDDPGLLDEVTGLVEWPVVLLGTIEPDFMDLPAEVLTTSMRTHQKYFACLDRDGKLAPKFLLVSNNIADDGGKQIVAGNERVLRARLSDARFFWDQDRKVRLEDRVPKLAERVFHASLGSMQDKVVRMAKLADHLAPQIRGADPARVRRAAQLAKADLSTGMVGEFPELQGIMGRYYARLDDEAAEVADAIGEHYSPAGPNDRCPSAPVSVAIALADRLDTLVGFFGLGEKPTGSRDPFALRRAALGVIRLLIDNRRHVELSEELRQAHAAYPRLSAGSDRVVADLLGFLGDRLKVHLRDQGIRHDVIDSAFVAGDDDLFRLKRRIDALAAFLDTEAGANLLVAYRRAANIVGIEQKRESVTYEGSPDVSLLTTREEFELSQGLDTAGRALDAAFRIEDFSRAMLALAELRGQIDDFFTKITVNDNDPLLRANRLRLLARIRDIFDRVADFSRIEG
jgi:glycyl-tRNA synthetase beta chain